MPYCNQCGTEVNTEMLFCHQCGSRLIIPETAQQNNSTQDSDTEVPIITAEDKPTPRVKRGRLYKQWVKYANLPDIMASPTISPGDMPSGEASKAQKPYLLYSLLGAAIAVCIIVIVFLTRN